MGQTRGPLKAARAKKSLFFLGLLFVFLRFPLSVSAQAGTVRIGVLAYRGAASARETWRATADYLSQKVPGYRFEIVPLDFRQIGPAVAHGTVDFLITNPSIYVEFESRYGTTRIATLKNLGPGGRQVDVFGGVIFTRAGRGDIKTMKDLKGKSFMAVDRTSLGGWRMALLQLKNEGINPGHYFSRISFGGTHDAVVYAVRDGEADAGTVRTDILERMAARGEIKLKNFRILGPLHYAHFPYRVSTALYPEWPFAKLRATPAELSRKVAMALFEMPARSQAAVTAGIAGWTVPLDYSSVQQLFKDLRFGIYRNYRKISLRQAAAQYALWLCLIMCVIALVIAAVVHMMRLNHGLRQSKLRLEAAKRELELKVKERTEELEALNRDLLQEIVERKQMEDARQDQIKFLQTLIDAIPAPIFYKNTEGVYIGCNDAFAALEGMKKEDIFGKSLRNIVPADRAALHLEIDRDLLANPGTRIYECPIVLSGCRHEMLLYKATFHRTDGAVGGIVGAIIDITERKHLEEALKESESRFRTIIESEPQCVKLIDRNGALITMNPAGLAMIEADSLEQVRGDNLCDLMLPEYKPAFWQLMEKVFNGETADLEFEITGLRGTNRRMTTHAVPFRNARGEIIALLAITIDVTEHRKLEEQLRHAHKMEAVGKLAGGIAHDFNNILSAIIGYADLLRAKLNGDKSMDHYAEQILSASQKAANLVKSLLAFSRKQVISLKPVDLNGLVRGFEKFLLRLIREDIELTIKCSGGELSVMADSGQIEQVLMNLAANARDAMPSGGRLIIETESVFVNEAFAKVNNFSKTGRYALISVTDTGVGMDRHVQNRVFDPFFTTKEIGKGTGLGLSIIYGIVEQHGGHVEILSEPGGGTTIQIYLPLAGARIKEEKEAPKEELPPGGTESILIAEDDPVLRSLTSTILIENGYKVIEAENGEDAVNKFRENRNDVRLLIFDVIMPRKNGKEAFQEIRKVAPMTKAIFMSGYAANIINGSAVEQADFIQKPVSPSVLLRKVREILDLHPSRPEG